MQEGAEGPKETGTGDNSAKEKKVVSPPKVSSVTEAGKQDTDAKVGETMKEKGAEPPEIKIELQESVQEAAKEYGETIAKSAKEMKERKATGPLKAESDAVSDHSTAKETDTTKEKKASPGKSIEKPIKLNKDLPDDVVADLKGLLYGLYQKGETKYDVNNFTIKEATDFIPPEVANLVGFTIDVGISESTSIVGYPVTEAVQKIGGVEQRVKLLPFIATDIRVLEEGKETKNTIIFLKPNGVSDADYDRGLNIVLANANKRLKSFGARTIEK